jgi:hypothetical protein
VGSGGRLSVVRVVLGHWDGGGAANRCGWGGGRGRGRGAAAVTGSGGCRWCASRLGTRIEGGGCGMTPGMGSGAVSRVAAGRALGRWVGRERCQWRLVRTCHLGPISIANATLTASVQSAWMPVPALEAASTQNKRRVRSAGLTACRCAACHSVWVAVVRRLCSGVDGLCLGGVACNRVWLTPASPLQGSLPARGQQTMTAQFELIPFCSSWRGARAGPTCMSPR